MSYYTCPSCSVKHHIFGSVDSFDNAVRDLHTTILGELPLVPAVSRRSDSGVPIILGRDGETEGVDAESVRTAMGRIARHILHAVDL